MERLKLKDIFDDYQYQILKLDTRLTEEPERYRTGPAFEAAARELEKLEALLDLYAYLIAHQNTDSQKPS